MLYTIIFVQEMSLPQKFIKGLKYFQDALVNEYIWNDQEFIE